MNVVKCDICGVTSDQKSGGWRSITVRKREGWNVEYMPIGAGVVREADDTWPGADRWEPPITPTPDLTLHFCGDECLEAGVRKLHKGCRLVAWSGLTLPVHVFAVTKVAAAQEP